MSCLTRILALFADLCRLPGWVKGHQTQALSFSQFSCHLSLYVSLSHTVCCYAITMSYKRLAKAHEKSAGWCKVDNMTTVAEPNLSAWRAPSLCCAFVSTILISLARRC